MVSYRVRRLASRLDYRTKRIFKETALFFTSEVKILIQLSEQFLFFLTYDPVSFYQQKNIYLINLIEL